VSDSWSLLISFDSLQMFFFFGLQKIMKTYQKENTGIGNFLRVVLLIIEVFLLLYFSLLVLDVMVLQTTSFSSTNTVLSKCSLLYVALASQSNDIEINYKKLCIYQQTSNIYAIDLPNPSSKFK